jgi:capsular exopolysaccharide synthesis family protein
MPGGDAGLSTIDLIRILWRRRLVLLTVVGLGLIGTTGAILWLPRNYVARAVLMIEPRLEPAPDGSGAVLPIVPDSAIIDSLAEVLASRSLARGVVGQLALAGDPELAPVPAGNAALAADAPAIDSIEPAAGPLEDTGLLDRFLGHLRVERSGKSNVITVSYASGDPQKAMAVANAIVGSFVAERQARREAAARRASAGLDDRLRALEAQLSASVAALTRARARNIEGGAPGTATAGIPGLQRDLITASAERASIEAKLARIKRDGPSPGDDARGSALLQNLEALKAEVIRREAENASQFGDRHPKLIDVRAERAEIEARIAAERRSVVAHAGDEVAAARAREGAISAAVAKLQGEAAGETHARASLRALEEQVELDRRLYEAQLARVRSASAPDATADVHIISDASLPGEPEFPKPALMLMVGLGSSLAIACFAVFTAEQCDSHLRTPEEVRATLGLPTLGLVPELPRRKLRGTTAEAWLLDHPRSCEAEALRTVLMGLDPRRTAEGARVVLVTSAVPGEGKSTLSLALARTAALEGLRVLLVDADLRRPRLGRMLGRLPGLGLAELAAERVRLGEVLLRDDRTSLLVIPGSAEAGPPTGLLGEKGVPAVLRAAREAYDLVIVDTAPLLPVADAARLALSADRVVLLLRWGQTSRAMAEQALLQLGVARDRLAGVVLGRVDLRRHREWAQADAAVAYGRYGSYYVS